MSRRTESGTSPKKLLAFSASAAMLTALGLASTPVWAEESPSPTEGSASPTTTEEDGHNPDFEAPETVDTYVGASVQVRMNADGQPNSNLANFRWHVAQVNAESTHNLDVAIPMPMDEAPMLRSLTGHGNMATEVDGGVIYEFPGVSSNQTKRTLNLWPQERDLPVNVTTKFWLDGEEVSAKDIVGKSGVTVKAEYTIHNQTVETRNVSYTDIAGEDAQEEATSSLGFVGISKAFIPQAWAQFDAGHGGIFGADGRGNYQTQWISLAFLPFAENGEAHFGWSAVVPGDMKAFIPKMVIEVSPLFVPKHDEGEAEEEAAAEDDNGVAKPDLDPATSMIHAGVEDLISGVSAIVDLLPEDEGPPKAPLTERLEGFSDTLTELSGILGGVIGDLDAALGSGGSGSTVTKDQLLKGVGAAITLTQKSIDDLEAYIASAACTPEPPPGPQREACDVAKTTLTQMNDQMETLKTLETQITALPEGELDVTALTRVREELNTLKQKLDGLNTSIKNLISTINQASDAASQAASGKSQISAGIGAASEEVSAYIANVVAVAQAAAAEGKTAAGEATKAANTVKAQIAGLKERLAESPLPYGGGMNTVYQAAGDTNILKDKAVSLLGEKGLAAEAEGVQPTTKLFGAYQFMLDPADTNKPNTIWRILLALILVAGAGLLGARVAKSRA